jgi:hypothetical protein
MSSVFKVSRANRASGIPTIPFLSIFTYREGGCYGKTSTKNVELLADTPFSTTFSRLADPDVDLYELGSVAATPQHVTCMRF